MSQSIFYRAISRRHTTQDRSKLVRVTPVVSLSALVESHNLRARARARVV
jgi:low temperature requirement protein LtrA